MPRGRPKSEKIDISRPRPLAGMPVCPSGLGKVAKAKWNELLRVLGTAGLLTQADADVLEQYCVAYETWRAARNKLKRKTPVITGRNGGDYPSPWVAIRNQAASEMRELSERLGLDPASRLELEADEPVVDDPKARFFKARLA